jgi:hypothetical protein
MSEACGIYGGEEGAYRSLVGKTEKKKQLGKHRRRWQDDIKMVFKDWDEDMDWIDLAPNTIRWRAFVKAVINVRGSKIFGEFLDWLTTS